MTRDIKFRAWYEPEHSMLDWGFLQTELNHYDKPFEDTPDYKVMQYTGLTDKNGTDIYEGDIINPNHEIKTRHYRYKEVKWAESRYRIGFNIGETNNNECEVIGNIYENPDLLK